MRGVDGKMATIYIYWDDLTEKAQDEIKAVLGCDPAKEFNWDTFPITNIDIETG